MPVVLGCALLALSAFVNGQTSPNATEFTGIPGAPLITVGGTSTIGMNVNDGAYIIGSQTLDRGSQVTVQGTTYSLARYGRNIVVDGHTSPITAGYGGYNPIFVTQTYADEPTPVTGNETMSDATSTAGVVIAGTPSTAIAASTTSISSDATASASGSTSTTTTTSTSKASTKTDVTGRVGMVGLGFAVLVVMLMLVH